MKRIYIALAVLVVAAVAFFLLRKNMGQTAKFGAKDFAISKPETIDKIFYSNKKGDYITLTKGKNGMWWVQNAKSKYPADTATVNYALLHIMPRIEVQNPVNDAALENVTRNMAISAVKAQFYSNGKEVKTFFVGDKTYDDLGTFMHLPGAERPCIVKIPGRNGYLTPYFSLQINDWRSLAMIDIPASDIKKLEVVWRDNPADGFIIEKNKDEVSLKNQNGQPAAGNRNRLLAYLDMFTNVSHEAGELAGINRTSKKDTILRAVPYFKLRITKTDGSTETLNVHQMPVSIETYTPETRDGRIKQFETDYYWGVKEGSDEIWVMQDVILKNRMKKINDLISQ